MSLKILRETAANDRPYENKPVGKYLFKVTIQSNNKDTRTTSTKVILVSLSYSRVLLCLKFNKFAMSKLRINKIKQLFKI